MVTARDRLHATAIHEAAHAVVSERNGNRNRDTPKPGPRLRITVPRSVMSVSAYVCRHVRSGHGFVAVDTPGMVGRPSSETEQPPLGLDVLNLHEQTSFL
jgi:hypothetical protein